MIDVHCHLLPFLDDGAQDWETSLEMARVATGEGIRQAILTPHWMDAPGGSDEIRSRADELRQRLAGAGIDLKLHLGNEVILVPRLVEALKEGSALTLAGSNYVLLETAQLEQTAYIREAIFQLQSNGYRIILAHPERVRSWHDDLFDVRDLVRRGCFLQVNAGSVLGEFGKGARKAALQFLELGWVSVLASDSHSATTRPPRLQAALRECAAILGDRRTEALVEGNPARILCDEQLPYPDADAEPRRRLFSLRWPWQRD